MAFNDMWLPARCDSPTPGDIVWDRGRALLCVRLDIASAGVRRGALVGIRQDYSCFPLTTATASGAWRVGVAQRDGEGGLIGWAQVYGRAPIDLAAPTAAANVALYTTDVPGRVGTAAAPLFLAGMRAPASTAAGVVEGAALNWPTLQDAPTPAPVAILSDGSLGVVNATGSLVENVQVPLPAGAAAGDQVLWITTRADVIPVPVPDTRSLAGGWVPRANTGQGNNYALGCYTGLVTAEDAANGYFVIAQVTSYATAAAIVLRGAGVLVSSLTPALEDTGAASGFNRSALLAANVVAPVAVTPEVDALHLIFVAWRGGDCDLASWPAGYEVASKAIIPNGTLNRSCTVILAKQVPAGVATTTEPVVLTSAADRTLTTFSVLLAPGTPQLVSPSPPATVGGAVLAPLHLDFDGWTGSPARFYAVLAGLTGGEASGDRRESYDVAALDGADDGATFTVRASEAFVSATMSAGIVIG